MFARCRLGALAAVVGLAGCHLIIDYKDSELDGSGGSGGGCTAGAVEPCYTGPEGTEGVGVCAAGVMVCQDDGAWTACQGDVTPQTEDCSQADDEDCNGFTCSETVWVRQIGAQAAQAYGGDVAIDPTNGDIYATGYLSGAVAFGNDVLDSQGETFVAFLAKFNRLGEPQWAKQFGKLNGSALDGEGAVGESLAVDGDRNVILVGRATPDIDLGGGSLPGGLFIGKFTPAGSLMWSKTCVGDDMHAVVDVDPGTNDVVLAGSYAIYGSGSINCGNVTHNGAEDIFVSRLAAVSGQELLSLSFGGAGSDAVADMAVDGQGNILLAGRGEALALAGGPALTGGFVAKLATNGSHVWSKGIGEGRPLALGLDGDGGLSITGAGEGMLNFGGGDLEPKGNPDLFVARLDAAGVEVWAERFGSMGDNTVYGWDIAVDAGGDIAVAGEVHGNVPIDNVVIAGDQLAFVAQFTKEGKAQWSRSFGRPGEYKLTFSSIDELIVLGQSSDATDFGTGTLQPAGHPDLFLFKIAQ